MEKMKRLFRENDENEKIVETDVENNNDIVEANNEKEIVEEKIEKEVEIKETKDIKQEVKAVEESLNADVIIPEANDDGVTVLKFKVENLDSVDLNALKGLSNQGVFITGDYIKTLFKFDSKDIMKAMKERM